MTESQDQSGKSRFDKLVPEQELLDRLGINKGTLDGLRNNEGFPYFRINKIRRLYYEEHVVDWLMGRKMPEEGNISNAV